MLSRLYIKNFAIIDEQELVFSAGLNIITGETGAGKSIVADALMLALGERASSDLVRHGANKAVIEAVFNLPEDHEAVFYVLDNGYDIENGEIILRREIPLKGNSRCFLNDTPLSVSDLKELGDRLVDFHGQHDHQRLLKNDSHLSIIDSMTSELDVFNEYKSVYSKLNEQIKILESISIDKTKIAEKIELNTIKLNEIESADLKINEDEEIESELNKLQNSEILLSISAEISDLLVYNSDSVYSTLLNVKKSLLQISDLDSVFSEFSNEFESALISINEIASFAKKYNSEIEFNPERIEMLRLRQQMIKALKKKYGSISDILEIAEKLKSEKDLFTNYDEAISKMKIEIAELEIELGKTADIITSTRKQSALNICKFTIDTLAELGIENARMQTDFRSEIMANDEHHISANITGKGIFKAYPNGIDKAEFLISTNLGEQMKPLADTASGGEISRIMIALKSLLAEKDRLPLLVFDEIDTGISGRIAQKVGLAIRKLAKSHQIISITHLPQIAAMGEQNIHLHKTEIDGRTITAAKILTNEEKIQEIAKMISGEEITRSALENAKELSELFL